MLLVYKGGPVVGYTLRVGDKYILKGQYECISQGMLVKFFKLQNQRTKAIAYLTPKEYIRSMEMIS